MIKLSFAEAGDKNTDTCRLVFMMNVYKVSTHIDSNKNIVKKPFAKISGVSHS